MNQHSRAIFHCSRSGASYGLPLLRVVLYGQWRHLVSTAKGYVEYDFLDDVRELACERVRDDMDAEWSDPRERLPLSLHA